MTSAEVEPVARTLARAFYDDPHFRWIVRDDSKRSPRMRRRAAAADARALRRRAPARLPGGLDAAQPGAVRAARVRGRRGGPLRGRRAAAVANVARAGGSRRRLAAEVRRPQLTSV